MDTQKLHDLIDKVIGKDGPLRTPAYWMRRVLNKIVGHVDDKVAELQGKLNRAISLTYKEFYDMHWAGEGIEGAYYHISDYAPTVSLTQEEFVSRKNIPYKLFVLYGGRDIRAYNTGNDNKRFADHTIFNGYVSTKYKDYAWDEDTGNNILEVQYVLHDSVIRNVRFLNDEYALSYIGGQGENGEYYSLQAEGLGLNGEWVFHDANSAHKYYVYGLIFHINGKNKCSLHDYESKEYITDLEITNYQFRTFGNIIRMVDSKARIDICYDYLGIALVRSTPSSAESNRIGSDFQNAKNLTIKGWPDGDLPLIFINNSIDKVDNLIIEDSAHVEMMGSTASAHNVHIYRSSSIKISRGNVENVEFIDCENIDMRSHCKHSAFYNCKYIQTANLSDIENSVFYDCEWVDVNFASFVRAHSVKGTENEPISPETLFGFISSPAIGEANAGTWVFSDGANNMKQGPDLRPLYPKTLTSAVVDEATGKTLAELLEEMKGGSTGSIFYDIEPVYVEENDDTDENGYRLYLGDVDGDKVIEHLGNGDKLVRYEGRILHRGTREDYALRLNVESTPIEELLFAEVFYFYGNKMYQLYPEQGLQGAWEIKSSSFYKGL